MSDHRPLVTVQGNHGPWWKQALLTLQPGIYRIIMILTRGNGSSSDIAIDDINHTTGPCPSPGKYFQFEILDLHLTNNSRRHLSMLA